VKISQYSRAKLLLTGGLLYGDHSYEAIQPFCLLVKVVVIMNFLSFLNATRENRDR
jgi:hypothetical protein